jgi:hypothetical protein
MKKILTISLISLLMSCGGNEKIDSQETTKLKVDKKEAQKAEGIEVEAKEVEAEINDNPAIVATKFYENAIKGDIDGLKKYSYWNHPEQFSRNEVGEHYVQGVIHTFEKNPRMKLHYEKMKDVYVSLKNPVYYCFNEERAVALLSHRLFFVYLGKFDDEWKVLAMNDGIYNGGVQEEDELKTIYQNLIKAAMDKNPEVTFDKELTRILEQ